MGVMGTVKRICRMIQRQNSLALELLGRPAILYGLQWTAVLAAVVTVASVSQELAFGSAISSHSNFSKQCNPPLMEGEPEAVAAAASAVRKFIRVPLDDPAHVLCLPSSLFKKSALDYVVPPVFAAVVVAASALFLYALALWDP